MRRKILALLLVAAAPLVARAEQLIPAGSLVQCTVAEPKLSSKTADVGDPVLCRISHVELYGRSTLPYGSYLVGRFEDYKDPGHFFGKGWMELKFDHMVVQPDTVIPVDAKVVYVKGYNVDKQGRILGKGHAVRDTLEWMVPILWPIDLLELPRRGPRPTLKEETRLTLKIMDDIGVPTRDQPLYSSNESGLNRRNPADYPTQAAAPIVQNFYQGQAQAAPQYAQPVYAPAPVVQTYVQPVPVPVIPYGYPARPYYRPPPPPPVAYSYPPAVYRPYAPGY